MGIFAPALTQVNLCNQLLSFASPLPAHLALSVGTNGHEILAELGSKPAIYSGTRVLIGVPNALDTKRFPCVRQAGFASLGKTD
jgi:hypothetical protein